MVVDHDSGLLIWAGAGANSETLNRFFDELGEELAARIEAVLRRRPAESQTVVFEDLLIDPDARTVHRGGELVNVTSKEFHLLELLARRSNRVVTRQIIMSTLWPLEERVDDNVLDAHIANLRQKLETGGGRRLIQTVRGFGYVLR